MNAISPAASLFASAISACAEAGRNLPANDNAGAAWNAADSKPYVDDRRVGVEVELRTARKVAAAVEGFGWSIEFSAWPRAAVSIRPLEVYSLSAMRRNNTLRAMLDAAGLKTRGC